MMKLGKMKKALLEASARREDGALLPAPDGLDPKSASCGRALRGLLKDGLAEERPTSQADATWREVDGVRVALFATPAGFGAMGATPPTKSPGAARDAAAKRPAGKLGRVLESIEDCEGASLDELVVTTGWLPHTTRAAIARLRQRGYDIRLDVAGGRKAYRLNAA